jgi:hypothetical protein
METRGRHSTGWGFRIAMVLLVLLGGAVAMAEGTPYGGSAARAGTSSFGDCPPSQEECILMGMTCVDYDVDGSCMTVCGLGCAASCAAVGAAVTAATGDPNAGIAAGIACSATCNAGCWEGCKFCEDWAFYWYCYCPGDPVPTIRVPPVEFEGSL